jgi:N-ethylmaleimide reductase
MPDSLVFQSYMLAKLALSNRLVMNPMTRSRSDVAGLANSTMAEYYSQRASAGLIITEGVAPAANGRGYARIPGLWNNEQKESWKLVTDAVHAKGGKIFVQLMHTGRVAHPANLPAGAEIVAPSAIAAPGQMYSDAQGLQDHPVPRAMNENDIQAAKESYVQASKNAIAAGFDGVELHSANGYLMEQFLNPHTNLREDAWGGSLEKRIKFVVETATAVAQGIGGDKVGIRLSPYGVNAGMLPYPEIDETYLKLVPALEKAGLVYLHIADHSAMGAPAVSPELKQKMRESWPRTFLMGGGFDLASAEKAIADGKTDLIGMGRAFLANPDLIERLKKGSALNAPDFATFYTPGPKGYTDYPSLAGVA